MPGNPALNRARRYVKDCLGARRGASSPAIEHQVTAVARKLLHRALPGDLEALAEGPCTN